MKQQPGSRKEELKSLRKGDEEGIVLISVIILMVILALVGTVTVMTTNTENNVSENYKTNTLAFYAAQAGIEEARERLRKPSTSTSYAGDPSAGGNDPLWVSYILALGADSASFDPSTDDPNYDAAYTNLYYPLFGNATNTGTATSSLQDSNISDISYWVKIRHKKWSDCTAAEQATIDTTNSAGGASAGDIIYYGFMSSGDSTAVTFTHDTPVTNICSPIELVTAHGMDLNSNSNTEVQVKKDIRPPVPGAFYGDVTQPMGKGGGNLTIIGDDNCTTEYVPAIAWTTTDTLSGSGGSTNFQSNGATGAGAASQVPDVDIEAYVNALKPLATVTLTADNTNFTVGGPTDYQIVFCDTSVGSYGGNGALDLKTTGIGGYGTLVVNGNLEFSGQCDWHGLVLVNGDMSFSGGGTKNIWGAAMAESVATLNGTVNIYYDSCEIHKTNLSYTYTTFRWLDKILGP